MIMTLDGAINCANDAIDCPLADEATQNKRSEAFKVLLREIMWLKKEITALQASIADDNR